MAKVFIYSVSVIILLVWLCILYKRQRNMSVKLNTALKSNDKNLINYNLATKLLYELQNGGEIAKRVKQNGFTSVAVYGMGPIGRFVVKELLRNGIAVTYAVDQNAELIYADVPVYNTEGILPQVDVMVVTAVYYYEQIKNTLKNKVKCPVVSLYDFLT